MVEQDSSRETIELRRPVPEDGASVFDLVERCPPLDPNSRYCNLLQCTHFAGTSVTAVQQDDIVGFISAYLVPDRADTLFIWQVAVSELVRGQGLATRMVNDILARPECSQVSYIETTITESNQASWALFQGLVNKLSTELHASVIFDKEQHFVNAHETEMLVRIGPIT